MFVSSHSPMTSSAMRCCSHLKKGLQCDWSVMTNVQSSLALISGVLVSKGFLQRLTTTQKLTCTTSIVWLILKFWLQGVSIGQAKQSAPTKKTWSSSKMNNSSRSTNKTSTSCGSSSNRSDWPEKCVSRNFRKKKKALREIKQKQLKREDLRKKESRSYEQYILLED